jgi:hypothetical protein
MSPWIVWMPYASSGRLENRSGLPGSSAMFVRTKRRAWRACGESIKGEENQRKAVLFCRENSCVRVLCFHPVPCTCERSCDRLVDRQSKLTEDFLTNKNKKSKCEDGNKIEEQAQICEQHNIDMKLKRG